VAFQDKDVDQGKRTDNPRKENQLTNPSSLMIRWKPLSLISDLDFPKIKF